MNSEEVDYELSLFLNNPLRFIRENKDTYEVYFPSSYKGNNKNIFISKFSNIIDAMRDRDLMVREWYGEEFYLAFEKLSDGLIDPKSKYKKIGRYYIDNNGNLYNELLWKINPEHTKNNVSVYRVFCNCLISEKDRSLYLSSEDLSKIYNGYGIVTMIKKKKAYVTHRNDLLELSYTKYSNYQYKDRKRARPVFNVKKLDKKILGVKNCFPNRFQSRIMIDKREYQLGSYLDPYVAQQIFFDAYYLFRGELHKEDKRSI